MRRSAGPGIVDLWYKEPLTEPMLADLRLLGGPLEYPWGQLSDGSFLVASCSLPLDTDITVEPSPLSLICLQRSDRQDRRVLIGGCHRAVCLWHRLQAGHPLPETASLYTGVPTQGFEFLASAVAPLWP